MPLSSDARGPRSGAKRRGELKSTSNPSRPGMATLAGGSPWWTGITWAANKMTHNTAQQDRPTDTATDYPCMNCALPSMSPPLVVPSSPQGACGGRSVAGAAPRWPTGRAPSPVFMSAHAPWPGWQDGDGPSELDLLASIHQVNEAIAALAAVDPGATPGSTPSGCYHTAPPCPCMCAPLADYMLGPDPWTNHFPLHPGPPGSPVSSTVHLMGSPATPCAYYYPPAKVYRTPGQGSQLLPTQAVPRGSPALPPTPPRAHSPPPNNVNGSTFSATQSMQAQPAAAAFASSSSSPADCRQYTAPPALTTGTNDRLMASPHTVTLPTVNSQAVPSNPRPPRPSAAALSPLARPFQHAAYPPPPADASHGQPPSTPDRPAPNRICTPAFHPPSPLVRMRSPSLPVVIRDSCTISPPGPTALSTPAHPHAPGSISNQHPDQVRSPAMQARLVRGTTPEPSTAHISVRQPKFMRVSTPEPKVRFVLSQDDHLRGSCAASTHQPSPAQLHDTAAAQTLPPPYMASCVATLVPQATAVCASAGAEARPGPTNISTQAVAQCSSATESGMPPTPNVSTARVCSTAECQ
eukprot:gene10830-1969_t